MFPKILIGLGILLLSSSTFAATPAVAKNKPELVLFVVIDQFRSDYLTRFASELLPATQKGSLANLMHRGAYFPNAEYEHFQCVTAPDHATLVTGAVPATHGVVLNKWPDAARGKLVDFEINSLNGTTLADELRFASPLSRTVGVAFKNRAAQILGGKRASLALAFDQKAWEWKNLASDEKSPPWLTAFQEPLQKLKGQKIQWLTHATEQGSRESTSFPQTEGWTTDMALRAAQELRLGQRGVTDWLGVSYSTFDYAGHLYDTRSPEMRDHLKSVDRAISRLVQELSKKVRLWIVVTADHGVSPRVEETLTDGIKAGRVNLDALKDAINVRAKKELGVEDAIAQVINFHFYFKPEIEMWERNRRIALEQLARATIEKTPGVLRAFTATEIRERRLPGGLIEKQLLNSYYPGRSGDIVVLPEPYFISEREEPVSHLTGYSYDRRVPVIFFAPGLMRTGKHLGVIHPTDLAPTLAALLDITPPPLSQGQVLTPYLSSELQ